MAGSEKQKAEVLYWLRRTQSGRISEYRRRKPTAEERIKALEKENKRLSEMNEFLEDAAAFFAASRQKSGKNKD